MLASEEEAYTDYLEHALAEAGVDPVVVRATLRQLGYDDATVAVMMGEASAGAVFSSSSSSSSSAPSQLTSVDVSVKAPSPGQAFSQQQQHHHQLLMRDAEASVASSAPSEMSRSPLHNGDHALGGAAEVDVDSPPDHSFVHPPSIMHESKLASLTPTSASSSASAAESEAAWKTEATPGVVASTQEMADRVAVGAAVAVPPRESEAATSSSFLAPRASHQKVPEEETMRVTSALPHKCSGNATDHNSSLRDSDFASRERDALLQWMNEYKALLLSSAMPRRASNSHLNGTPVQRRPLEEPFDESHLMPHTDASSICRTCEAEGREGVVRRSWSKQGANETRSRPHRCCHCKKTIDDGPLSESFSSSSGGFSGDAQSSTSASSAPVNARVHRDAAAARAKQVRAPVVYRTSEKGCWRRHASASHAAAAAAAAVRPFRHVVPRAKSALFVPTCDFSSPGGGGATTRVRFAVAEVECRHPYREAQDVRIVRASHGLADEMGRGVSQSRARELDAARQTQHTSRAAPANGRHIPVMHAPVQPSVHPQSGLAGGRQSTTLPRSARTDRVALAGFYRREWERQERRITMASRSAAWDTRYALLSCATAPRSS